MSQSPARTGNSDALGRYAKAWSATNILTRQGRTFSGHEPHCCFLNTGQQRFADVSASLGLDLPEDGRSLALVDWDHDGDVDLWLTNRTAPRVRFFRNDYPRRHHFLSVRLRGRSCNRDAIGARLELVMAGWGTKKKIQTIHAGDGFLGQSSKTVHFGLGAEDKIDRLTIRWPGGTVDTIHDLHVDRHYRIIQGSREAQEWTPPQRTTNLRASNIEIPASSEQARIVLVGRVPLPDAPYRDWQGNLVSLAAQRHGPTLVNLGASWCQPCLVELQDFGRHADDLRAAGLEVIALSVDGLGQSSASVAGQQVLHRLRFPFASGAATNALVTGLDIVQRTLLDRKRPLPVPSSFLIDPHGQIAVIYKGPVGVDQLLEDVKLLDADPGRLRDLAVPLAGRWFTPPAASDPLRIAGELHDSGLNDLAQRFAEQLHVYFTEGAGRRYTPDSARSQKLAELHAFRGALLLEKNEVQEAAAAWQLALQLDPQNHRSRVKLGEALTRLGKAEQAARQFSEALAIEPGDADTHYNLAIVLTGLGEHRSAIAHYRQVLQLRPNWPPAANNLAWILATHPDPELRNGADAVKFAEAVCQQVNFRDPTGLDTLAASLAEAGQFETAIRTNRQAIELATAQQKASLVESLRQRMQLYQAGQPYRDPALRSLSDAVDTHSK